MNNDEYTLWFALLGLFNTNLGFSNIEKNIEQERRQIRIEAKLDKILEKFDNESKQ